MDQCIRLVRGVARAELASELPAEHTYREMHAFLAKDVAATSLDQVETIRRCAFDIASALNPMVAQPLLTALAHVDDPGMLCDLAGSTLLIEPDARQRVLEATDIQKRLDVVVSELGAPPCSGARDITASRWDRRSCLVMR